MAGAEPAQGQGPSGDGAREVAELVELEARKGFGVCCQYGRVTVGLGRGKMWLRSLRLPWPRGAG